MGEAADESGYSITLTERRLVAEGTMAFSLRQTVAVCLHAGSVCRSDAASAL